MVVKFEVAVDVLVPQPVEVSAMFVIVTTLDAPAVLRAAVVKVPVPLAKLIEAVVELTVLVPLTL